MRWLFAVSSAALLALVSARYHAVSDDFIDKINKEVTTWKAGRNFDEHLPMSYFKRLMGALPTPKSKMLPKIYHPQKKFEDLPAEFDSRVEWTGCPSIGQIRDQGNCGSCWAISSVEVMTDRTCIHSNEKKNFDYSVEELLTCCQECGGGSCYGGWPAKAFKYWVNTGIVSGGPYNSSQGCQPYLVPPYFVNNQDRSGPEYNLACVKKCEPEYNVNFDQDKHHGSTAYSIAKDEKQIMTEIMKNGPVVAAFGVYEDFMHYKSGVYKHTIGQWVGGHAIKILGWGEENGIKFWLCANSWSYIWGDQGFFKILRGVDECQIEDNVNCGLPRLS